MRTSRKRPGRKGEALREEFEDSRQKTPEFQLFAESVEFFIDQGIARSEAEIAAIGQICARYVSANAYNRWQDAYRVVRSDGVEVTQQEYAADPLWGFCSGGNTTLSDTMQVEKARDDNYEAQEVSAAARVPAHSAAPGPSATRGHQPLYVPPTPLLRP